MGKICKNITEAIGGTPLVELSNIEKKHGLQAQLLAKLEYLNPAGSTKDRAALYMILDAEEKGLLSEGSVIIEPTSGNTGIGLASVAAVRGYRVILTMPDTMSVERINILKAYGAEIVLTDGSLGMTAAVEKAEELARSYPNSFIPSQFENPANAEAHRRTTGPEIWADIDGDVDILVAAVGTGGTLTGTGSFLKSKKPELRVVAVEPESSPLLSRGVSGPHKIQGIGANFIPKLLDTDLYDEVFTVNDEVCFDVGKEIARSEGFLVGISSGAAAYAAIQIARRPENRGKKIVVILPDSGDRYYSTPLFGE